MTALTSLTPKEQATYHDAVANSAEETYTPMVVLRACLAIIRRLDALTVLQRSTPSMREANAVAQTAHVYKNLVHAREERDTLATLARREHLVVEGDCWFSCPRSGQCCNDDADKSVCTCGADAHNAKVDAALAR